MDTSYDVRIYKIDVYKSRRKNGQDTYWVRWKVAKELHKEPFKGSALADSYRSELIAAARKGEAFRVDDGLPVSKARSASDVRWYEFACSFIDMKWPHVAATTRRTNAEAMSTITASLLADRRGMPDGKLLRKAMVHHGFNASKRHEASREVVDALDWLSTHTVKVSALADPATLRAVLDSLTVRLDGKRAASNVIRRKRSVLSHALNYAVERAILDKNPISALKWEPPKTTSAIDKRRVPTPLQAGSLLNAIGTQQRTGQQLRTFFACLYYAGMRPEEAVALRRANLGGLPPEGWGEILLSKAEPHAGRSWTDSGTERDRRGLKHRASDDTRPVPCPPRLTAILNEHLAEFGTTADGHLFRGERADELPRITIWRAWQRARREVFTPDVLASSLAATPYDLRHAALSTWLNGGVPAPKVAEWAGNSVEVLLKVYAKCLDGSDDAVRRLVQTALGHPA